eukprot:CAMPEP_0119126362 /NCGR_PEP_ID=MMETSP1310-20130426/5320_1 /TAXON_ID=464262 /ORGANISM="Genus nov. species nov., Strain RCC2339" /LENGTH=336 /DNA_ID=CAMNT_0007116519 /DNA_START=86 /DNA_END=1096 /DNA_ORIENTATION=+
MTGTKARTIALATCLQTPTPFSQPIEWRTGNGYSYWSVAGPPIPVGQDTSWATLPVAAVKGMIVYYYISGSYSVEDDSPRLVAIDYDNGADVILNVTVTGENVPVSGSFMLYHPPSDSLMLMASFTYGLLDINTGKYTYLSNLVESFGSYGNYNHGYDPEGDMLYFTAGNGRNEYATVCGTYTDFSICLVGIEPLTGRIVNASQMEPTSSDVYYMSDNPLPGQNPTQFASVHYSNGYYYSSTTTTSGVVTTGASIVSADSFIAYVDAGYIDLEEGAAGVFYYISFATIDGYEKASYKVDLENGDILDKAPLQISSQLEGCYSSANYVEYSALIEVA